MAVNYDREKQDLTRRNFLSAAGWAVAGVGMLGFLGQVGRFSWPNVQYGPPSKFSIGKPTLYPDGAKQNIADQKVSIIRHGGNIGAISMVCQHLGSPWPPPAPATTAPATAPSTTTWATSPTAPPRSPSSGSASA